MSYLKCLTQLFNLSQDLCGGKASIRLDWTCDCKFEPSKQLYDVCCPNLTVVSPRNVMRLGLLHHDIFYVGKNMP